MTCNSAFKKNRTDFEENLKQTMPKQFQAKDNYLVGVISDTHGRLPQKVWNKFNGVDLIIHAGDIGDPEILNALANIAPTIAVRGNMDMGKWVRRLPEKEVIKIGETVIHVLHDLYRLESNPDSAGYRVVINGHTHRPLAEEKQGILYLNPGSAVLPKFGHPATVALLRINRDSIEVQLIELR